jgi:hypothetical protein
MTKEHKMKIKVDAELWQAMVKGAETARIELANTRKAYLLLTAAHDQATLVNVDLIQQQGNAGNFATDTQAEADDLNRDLWRSRAQEEYEKYMAKHPTICPKCNTENSHTHSCCDNCGWVFYYSDRKKRFIPVPEAGFTEEFRAGYKAAMNWKQENHLEHLPAGGKLDAFCNFIGSEPVENDGGWSLEVWNAAWDAAIDAAVKVYEGMCGDGALNVADKIRSMK